MENLIKSFFLNPIFFILLGILVPNIANMLPLMPLLLMAIMFLSFLKMNIHDISESWKNIGFQLLTQSVCGIFSYIILYNFNEVLAIAALLMFLTPTAISAPAITKKLGGRMEIVASSVILSNIVFSILFVFIILLASKTNNEHRFDFIYYTATIILIPFLLSTYLKKTNHFYFNKIKDIKDLSFYIWLVVIMLASSSIRNIIFSEQQINVPLLIGLSIISICIFAISLALGHIFKTNFKIELSQSLSQKNTVISVWISIHLLPDYISIVPILYSLIQNSWFTYKLNIREHVH